MSHGLVSIGYEGRTIESLIETLKQNGVALVADVRLNAISRKRGFSKQGLSAALRDAGIDYLHMRSLGNPRDNREPFWRGDVAKGRAVFKRQLDSAQAQEDLGTLIDRSRRSITAVLCFEADTHSCHRQVVLDELAADAALPVVTVG